MPTNLYLVRHGESFPNVTLIMGGMKGDKGLTERGVAQARALARRLRERPIPVDVFYASTLPRARQTAEIIADSVGKPIVWDDEIQELRVGEADGMGFEEARAQYRGMQVFLKELYTPIAPGGESWGSFQMRVSAALERLVTQHAGQNIMAVCHGGVIEVSFLHFMMAGPQLRGSVSFYAENTAITHWRHHVTHSGRAEWHIVAHNDCWHLLDI